MGKQKRYWCIFCHSFSVNTWARRDALLLFYHCVWARPYAMGKRKREQGDRCLDWVGRPYFAENEAGVKMPFRESDLIRDSWTWTGALSQLKIWVGNNFSFQTMVNYPIFDIKTLCVLDSTDQVLFIKLFAKRGWNVICFCFEWILVVRWVTVDYIRLLKLSKNVWVG